MKKFLSLLFVFTLFLSIAQLVIPPSSSAFSRIVDLVFGGEPVDPGELGEILATIRKNKSKNKFQRNPKKLKPDKLEAVLARQKDPQNIQIEIDTSSVLVKTGMDIQALISNKGFLDSVTEAINLWDEVDIGDIMFAPIKFASAGANPEDGKNVISFRAIKTSDEGTDSTQAAGGGGNSLSIVTFAKTDTIIFMNEEIMVTPGTILDADTIYDPDDNPCLEIHRTTGAFKICGDENAPIAEGGIDPTLTAEDLESCANITSGDVTEIAAVGIGHLLGLENSAIISSVTSSARRLKERYALTNDDKIGLANIYPNNEALNVRGTLVGKVTLNNKPVTGAHVVIEDPMTGEPIASTITTLDGEFNIKALPEGAYTVYAEPVDSAIRKNALNLNFFGFASQTNFTTSVFPEPVTITAKKTTNIAIKVQEVSASSFNINSDTVVLKEEDVNADGGAAFLPLRIMPGQTLSGVRLWGDNISTDFGTLSVSGPGITVSNITNASVPISPFVKCEDCTDTADSMCKRDPRCPPSTEITEEPDQIPGLTADITCAAGTPPGPRSIIFTGDMLDPLHPSFGLRDQITGGLVVVE